MLHLRIFPKEFSVCVSVGSIPTDLEGTLLRNGPGLFKIGGVPVSQPFDGDGMVGVTRLVPHTPGEVLIIYRLRRRA